jgi:hypothetical protein
MTMTRIYEVIEESRHDEGNPFTRASFDNDVAAAAFIEAVHQLEYEHYLSERARWSLDEKGNPPEGWTLSDDKTFLARHEGTLSTVHRGKTLISYLPPKPVSYERWLMGDVNLVPTDFGPGMMHTFDQMHTPSSMRVEPGWLYGQTPALVWDGMALTEDEAQRRHAAIEELLSHSKRSTDAR